jgi:hypothetical protein
MGRPVDDDAGRHGWPCSTRTSGIATTSAGQPTRMTPSTSWSRPQRGCRSSISVRSTTGRSWTSVAGWRCAGDESTRARIAWPATSTPVARLQQTATPRRGPRSSTWGGCRWRRRAAECSRRARCGGSRPSRRHTRRDRSRPTTCAPSPAPRRTHESRGSSRPPTQCSPSRRRRSPTRTSAGGCDGGRRWPTRTAPSATRRPTTTAATRSWSRTPTAGSRSKRATERSRVHRSRRCSSASSMPRCWPTGPTPVAGWATRPPTPT